MIPLYKKPPQTLLNLFFCKNLFLSQNTPLKREIQNSYLKGDPVTFRPLAESWDFLKNGDFSDITGIPVPAINGQIDYERSDALDDYKGYSQRIKSVDVLTAYDIGIIQSITGKARSVLNRLALKLSFEP